MPGLIDSHIHYPQSEMIGMYGKQLLDWLNEYTYPTEEAFGDSEYAGRVARFFVNELFATALRPVWLMQRFIKNLLMLSFRLLPNITCKC